MARPKKQQTKERVNLTIDKEPLEKGKRTANHLKKSLSEFTQDMYVDLHDNFFGLDKDPQKMLKHFKNQISNMETIYKKNLEGKKDKQGEDNI